MQIKFHLVSVPTAKDTSDSWITRSNFADKSSQTNWNE